MASIRRWAERRVAPGGPDRSHLGQNRPTCVGRRRDRDGVGRRAGQGRPAELAARPLGPGPSPRSGADLLRAVVAPPPVTARPIGLVPGVDELLPRMADRTGVIPRSTS